MRFALLLLLLGIPIIEIALFVIVGSEIGVLPTLTLVVLTTVLGVWLVRAQGLSTLARARAELARDQVPAGPLAEGFALLLAGILLLIPGFFTDTIGLLLLIPPVRRRLMGGVAGWVARNTVVMGSARGFGHGRRGGTIIEGEAVEIQPDRPRLDDSPWRSP